MKIKYHKTVVLCLLLIMVGLMILIVRIVSPEDTWLCTNSGWVKHGVPISSKPTLQCSNKK